MNAGDSHVVGGLSCGYFPHASLGRAKGPKWSPWSSLPTGLVL